MWILFFFCRKGACMVILLQPKLLEHTWCSNYSLSTLKYELEGTWKHHWSLFQMSWWPETVQNEEMQPYQKRWWHCWHQKGTPYLHPPTLECPQTSPGWISSVWRWKSQRSGNLWHLQYTTASIYKTALVHHADFISNNPLFQN